MGRGRPRILSDFPSSSTIKIMVSEHLSLFMQIIKDKNKHGEH